MDLLQTLLLYMSATMLTGLQAAPTPEVTPVPTAPPVQVIPAAQTEDPLSIGSAIVTLAPEGTPVPTITPNKQYPILRRGAKGAEVRKMQQRLKDLGYLTGNVDGSFGNQTYSAVLRFQKENGLTRDGVAGQMTLTILYESPSVMPNPSAMTPTPQPTMTPGPDGLVPIPENPTGNWEVIEGAKTLINGNPVTLLTTAGQVSVTASPRVWRQAGDVLVSLSDLAEAAEGWELTSDGAASFQLETVGFEIRVMMSSAASDKRDPNDDVSFCDSYVASSNASAVNLEQGEVMYENGEWTVRLSFLEKALQCNAVWENDEKTLLIRLVSRAVSQSVD